MVLTARLDENALGPDASLFVGVDDLVGPRDRCCQVGVHFSRHLARHKPQQLDSNGDCEPVASRGSDACKVAALRPRPHANASSTTSLYSGVSIALRTIVGFVVQSTGLRRATAPRSPVSATSVVIARS